MTRRRSSRKRNKSSPLVSSPKKSKHRQSTLENRIEELSKSEDCSETDTEVDTQIVDKLNMSNMSSVSAETGSPDLCGSQTMPLSVGVSGAQGNIMTPQPVMDPNVFHSQMNVGMPVPQQLLTFPATVHQSGMSEQDILRVAQLVKSMLHDEIDKIVEVRVATETESLRKELSDLKVSYNQLQSDMKDLTTKYDDMEQYSRRSCLRISGIPEPIGETEDVSKIVLDLAKRVGSKVALEDIDRAHRIGRPRPNNDAAANNIDARARTAPGREIIIKFTNSTARLSLLKGRAKLREERSEIFINEDLTSTRKNLAYECRKIKKAQNSNIKKTWVYAGSIYIVDSSDTKKRITCLSDLDPYQARISERMDH